VISEAEQTKKDLTVALDVIDKLQQENSALSHQVKNLLLQVSEAERESRGKSCVVRWLSPHSGLVIDAFYGANFFGCRFALSCRSLFPAARSSPPLAHRRPSA
jgi:hypothetical protein